MGKDEIEAAIDDANRTLEQKSMGYGKFTVSAIEVEFLEYDEDRDGMFLPDERQVIRVERDVEGIQG